MATQYGVKAKKALGQHFLNDESVARRIVDFISGAVHALDGHIQKISNSIFLIAPTYYEISTEIARDEIKNK